MSAPLALHVRFDDDNMWIALSDGRTLGVPHAYFPRLLNASAQQRSQYLISGAGTCLHCYVLYDDIRRELLLLGHAYPTQRSPVSG